MSEVDAATYFKQVLNAVRWLHEVAKIAHRDLKPENFLFQTKEAMSPLKLIDFGLAARFCIGHEEQKLNDPVGTPYFVAPEVVTSVQGKVEYDGPQADMWSAGVILFYMLAGQRPFAAKNLKELFAKLQQFESLEDKFAQPAFAGISRDAKDILSNLIHRSPQARLTASKALKHAWITSITVAKYRPSITPLIRAQWIAAQLEEEDEAEADNGRARAASYIQAPIDPELMAQMLPSDLGPSK
mmetsp:Transcript_69395/g.159408  ORF Transcript_69395/g.159408 Transcript_69395/m.159408 type:complete len:242 (+) Transcript_69395:452-1177(+)